MQQDGGGLSVTHPPNKTAMQSSNSNRQKEKDKSKKKRKDDDQILKHKLFESNNCEDGLYD